LAGRKTRGRGRLTPSPTGFRTRRSTNSWRSSGHSPSSAPLRTPSFLRVIFMRPLFRVSQRTLLLAGLAAWATLTISCTLTERAIIVPPQIAGATIVGSGACAKCHGHITSGLHDATHARLMLKDDAGPAQNGPGESCPGPGRQARSGSLRSTSASLPRAHARAAPWRLACAAAPGEVYGDLEMGVCAGRSFIVREADLPDGKGRRGRVSPRRGTRPAWGAGPPRPIAWRWTARA